jgi:poly(A) polymerase
MTSDKGPALDRAAVSALVQRPALRQLLDVLNTGDEETRIVGGAIRNVLLGRPVVEVDLATTAVPDAVSRRSEQAGFKVVPTGVDHGTVTVLVDREAFEVTTLREDVETDGRRAVVRYGRDFAADARRRDFTINALSAGQDGRLYDYVDGLADLQARRVRFIGDPTTRIREDFLRILRFFRFHSEFASGAVDPEALAACVRQRAGLAILSHERVRAELLKLLGTRRAVEVIGLLSDTGLLVGLLAGVVHRGRLERVAAFEKARGEEPDPVRRLAAAAVETTADADRLRERLRLSNHEHGRLVSYATVLTGLKTASGPVDGLTIRRLVAEHGIEPVADVLAAIAGEPRPDLRPDAMPALEFFRSGREPVPVFPLRGADLVRGGIPMGPRVGAAMASARRHWLAEGCPVDEEAHRRLLVHALASDASAGS